ncbi:amidase signature domain-containing protein [Dactylonectria estremocensis]|uniref:Amidase signature domain-containing protein n=1 Tax=Dactylonectria estremocensis TaxID=1079267 RepID=A0A9P9EQ39_9HYPO|nr:amidase signature domain-containing protein [Dactylonectria estremocensis]
MAFNTLTTNAVDLQQWLKEDKITSIQIVKAYFAQIDLHEPALNALISAAPRDGVVAIAAALDQERQQGKLRSPFHGIPIILKDSFVTASDLGIGNTAGSLAFRLIDAGLMILGKANMTEFTGMKMTMMMPSWSAYSGQTLSPYVRKMEENEKLLGHSAPGGLSTGSAVAVAAGFSPLAMATEIIGSIVTPSTCADTTGLYTMTEFFDSPGPMAKSAADVCAVAEILFYHTFSCPRLRSWQGLSVGFLDLRVWNMAADFCMQFQGIAEQMVAEYEVTVSSLKSYGCPFKYLIDLKDVLTLLSILPIAYWDFKNVCIPEFIKAFDECPVRCVADIVEFNRENSEKALPAHKLTPIFTEQNDLEAAMNSTDDKEHIQGLKQELRAIAKHILDEMFEKEQINLIVAPGDAPLCVHAAAAGYPVATVPVGQLRHNNRLFGLCLVGKADEEEMLL